MTLTPGRGAPPTHAAAELHFLRTVSHLSGSRLPRRAEPDRLACDATRDTADGLSFHHLDQHGLIEGFTAMTRKPALGLISGEAAEHHRRLGVPLLRKAR